MKIAIVSDDGTTIASHFGSAKGFIIYEIVDGQARQVEYRVNTFTGHARGLEGTDHGVDRHGPILEALNDCQAVISRGMGRRIYDDLVAANIDPYVTDEPDAQKAAELHLKGGLVHIGDFRCDHKHKH